MGLSVLRRRTKVEQVPVTTLFWDVAAEVSAEPEPPAAPRAFVAAPSYTPGLCWHKVHVQLDGERYGISPAGSKPYQRGAITPCEHLSRVGGR